MRYIRVLPCTLSSFMCTTHDRMVSICDHFRTHPDLYEGFKFYPSMPYAHKYANAVTDLGMIGAVNRFLPKSDLLSSVLKGGIGIARQDLGTFAGLLIDAEMRTFAGLSTPVIFLQNVVTDLLLGLGAHDALRIFDEHVRTRYAAEPGYITMNLPLLLNVLNKLDIENPVVCANINKVGFRMSGGAKDYESLLADSQCRAVAMSVFASGAIPADEAIDYVCNLNGVESIVFGASSQSNIISTKALVDKYWA